MRHDAIDFAGTTEAGDRQYLPKCPDHSYEAAKAAWIAAHPDATPAQYQDAIQRICRELGY